MASDVSNGMRHLESKQVALLLLGFDLFVYFFSFSGTHKVKVHEVLIF